jgi:hypothetical protein
MCDIYLEIEDDVQCGENGYPIANGFEMYSSLFKNSNSFYYEDT